MLKVFQKIRKKLLEEGKLRNYLVYSIGEIFLIVVGILLALQINNWNVQNKNIELEKKILIQISDEIENNFSDLNYDSDVIELGLKSNLNIQKYIQNDIPYSDSMVFEFYWLKQEEYPIPHSAGYESLKSIGFNLIRDDSLRTLIQTLYEAHYPRISKGAPLSPDIADYFSEFYKKHFKPNTDTSLKYSFLAGDFTLNFPAKGQVSGVNYTRVIGYIPLNWEELKKNSEFQIILRDSQRFRVYKLRRYKRAIKTCSDILEMITNKTGK